MNLLDFRRIVHKFRAACSSDYLPGSPDTPVITGRYDIDQMIHFLSIKHGVELILEHKPLSGQWQLIDYRIVDEKKFMWFVMRWA